MRRKKERGLVGLPSGGLIHSSVVVVVVHSLGTSIVVVVGGVLRQQTFTAKPHRDARRRSRIFVRILVSIALCLIRVRDEKEAGRILSKGKRRGSKSGNSGGSSNRRIGLKLGRWRHIRHILDEGQI